jgi:DNA-binding LacI/PurR family transcriptional regulator
MAATIEQIAERVGVSAGTVSRVLNGKNKENRPAIARRADRIRRIANELGYRPNAAARQMLRGKFDLIALLNCGDLGFDWFPRPLLHGLHDRVAGFGSRLAITELPMEGFREPDFAPDVLRQSQFDGLIVHLSAPQIERQVQRYFNRDPLPVVYVNQKLPHRGVYPDEVQGGRMAASALIQAGHREIGFLTSGDPFRPDAHFSEADRAAGFRQVMEEHGLNPERFRRNLQWDHNDQVDDAKAYLHANPEMTAVVVYKIEMASALREAAHRLGRIDDLQLVLFHEAEFHANMSFRLPTLIIPFREVGVAAADMVQQLIDHHKVRPRSIAVPYAQFYGRDLIRPPRTP